MQLFSGQRVSSQGKATKALANQINRLVAPLLMAGLFIAATSTSAARWNPLKKPLAPITDSADKIGRYVSKKTGNEQIQANINGASSEATKLAKQTQQKLNELTPTVRATAESVKQTSDGVSELVKLIKWPLFALTVAFALLMSCKALAAWKTFPTGGKAAL